MKQVKFLYRQKTTTGEEILAQLSAHFGADSVVPCEGAAEHLCRDDVLIVLLANPRDESSPGFPIDRLEAIAEAGVAAALKEGTTIIPVLLDGATMPAHKQLPRQIRKLAFQHAMPIRGGQELPRDVGRLIRDLEVLLQREVGRVFAWDYWLLPIGLCLALAGLCLRVVWHLEITAWTFGYHTLAALEYASQWLAVISSLVLGSGMVIVMIGFLWRRHRYHVAQRSAFYRSGTGSLPPQRGLAEAGCSILGAAALGWGWWSAAPAAILGLIAIGRQRSDKQRRTATGFVLFGLATGLMGVVWMSYLQRSQSRFQTALVAYEAGQLHLKAKDFEEAQLSFQLAVESYPQFGQPYFGSAKAHAQSGNFDQALAMTDEALKRYPDTYQGLWEPTHRTIAEAYRFRAKLHDRSDQPELADQDRQLADDSDSVFLGGLFRFWDLPLPPDSQPPTDLETDSWEDNIEDAPPITPAPEADPTAQQWKHRSIMGSRLMIVSTSATRQRADHTRGG